LIAGYIGLLDFDQLLFATLCVVHSDCKTWRNTMACDSRQVCVSGVPADMSEEVILLFFESRKFCPSGGPVENVDLNLQTQTAIITFCDSAGIF